MLAFFPCLFDWLVELEKARFMVRIHTVYRAKSKKQADYDDRDEQHEVLQVCELRSITYAVRKLSVVVLCM